MCIITIIDTVYILEIWGSIRIQVYAHKVVDTDRGQLRGQVGEMIRNLRKPNHEPASREYTKLFVIKVVF